MINGVRLPRGFHRGTPVSQELREPRHKRVETERFNGWKGAGRGEFRAIETRPTPRERDFENREKRREEKEREREKSEVQRVSIDRVVTKRPPLRYSPRRLINDESTRVSKAVYCATRWIRVYTFRAWRGAMHKTLLYESASAAIWSTRPRPLRLLFTSAHNAISFYFAPPPLPRYRLRSHNAAGWRSRRREKSGREREKRSLVPFSTLPRLRVKQSQVDFSPTFSQARPRSYVNSTYRRLICIFFPTDRIFWFARGNERKGIIFPNLSRRNSITGIWRKILEYLKDI